MFSRKLRLIRYAHALSDEQPGHPRSACMPVDIKLKENVCVFLFVFFILFFF